MITQIEFPDLIKAGLKVGDTVYSYLYGDGKVEKLSLNDSYPIVVSFDNQCEFGKFTKYGCNYDTDLMPSITLTPWNPVAGEPFPFPKWEPIVGDVYAFWDDDMKKSFCVSKFESIVESEKNYYIDHTYTAWSNCAPIEEAMRIFGFDKPQSHE